MTKISIEKRVYSERKGSEKPISAFQSRIACGQNPMVEHPSNLFLIHYLEVKKIQQTFIMQKIIYNFAIDNHIENLYSIISALSV